MKISIASDIHLEFGDLDLRNSDGAEVLILSGDICVARDVSDRDDAGWDSRLDRNDRIHDFFQRCAAEFAHVIYVVGNHEHYHGDFAETVPALKKHLGYISNLHILDRECRDIDGVTFIGGTLWTDMNGRDDLTLYHMTSMMNDFRCVLNSNSSVSYKKMVPMLDENGRQLTNQDGTVRYQAEFSTRPAKFSPQDAVVEFDAMTGYIGTVTEGQWDRKFVVVGHHSPSRLSTHERYRHDNIMNGGYSSNLDEFILNHPQIKLWTHGHTHHNFDYCIGSTRIVCNPRGYIGYEEQADQWTLQTVTI